MIPVVMLDNKGEVIGQQAFNDNLTAVEQLNRELLAAIVCSQQKLTNLKNDVDKYIMYAKRTDEDVAQLKTAADALVSALNMAVKTFETAVQAVIVPADDSEDEGDGE